MVEVREKTREMPACPARRFTRSSKGNRSLRGHEAKRILHMDEIAFRMVRIYLFSASYAVYLWMFGGFRLRFHMTAN